MVQRSEMKKIWGLPRLSRKSSGLLSTKRGNRSDQTDSYDSLGIRDGTGSSINEVDGNQRQLRELVHRMRSGPSGPKEIDSAYELYMKHRDRAHALCRSILADEFKPRQLSNVTETMARRDSSLESPSGMFDHRSSFSGRSLTEVVTGSAGRSTHVNDNALSIVRDWRIYLESLAESFKQNLADTYRKFETDANTEKIEALFNNKRYRKEAVNRMRNASVTRVMSADPQFEMQFPRYEIRFRNYEKVKQDLIETRALVQAGESGISPDRECEDIAIAPLGDAILEFANLSPEAVGTEPVVRFRVNSQVLAPTSPIFARMFPQHHQSPPMHDDDDIHMHLPPPATRYLCRDGSEARLYRMPQVETNRWRSLEILLYAAHMRADKIPREVEFEQFVAIAECCLRYKCTSPLELIVEHRWLPQCIHNGGDDMADGMLAISYAFGLQSIFTRVSKSAILNLVDESDLHSKPWPQKIKNKIWAVRCAKVAQVYACCTSAIQEYIRRPSRNLADEVPPITPSALRSSTLHPASLPKPAPSVLSTTPRCPKGSHWCDAGNLGWIMLVYNELNVLSQIVRPNVLTHLPESMQQPSQSLAQILETLRRTPSPLSPIHRGGVCDPSPAFRAAVNDVFNSISGLTLHDVSGKSHGWALTKYKEAEPQETDAAGLDRMAAPDRGHHSVAAEFPEHVRLKLLSMMNDPDDLRAAAMINSAWYDTYKTHELFLVRGILRSGHFRADTVALRPNIPKSISNAEEKVPKEISDRIQEEGSPDAADTVTIRSEEESEFDDGESIAGHTPAPSITPSLTREMRTRNQRTQLTEEALQRTRTASPPRLPYTMPPPPTISDGTNTPGASSTLTSSPTTPRASSPTPSSEIDDDSKGHVVYAEYADEPPLTDEEARRILWGDDEPEEPRQPPQEEGLREKFRYGDVSFVEGLEDKMLLVDGQKRLLTEGMEVRRQQGAHE
ncbi:uncharacterized protein F5Z01DRAFT_638404 [Emericellopsis atlantica]|uniref:BTB domain-containing protein n=1 Tax=Emericellopsis atlantica TaxID=2614577 RepID=A0A9P7ZIH5_9HYPO|nr:uncharacterized protein F5Z01DRAFT_638404 [Emericellopsis atlantica]KAG9252536.1 hypothetical protein F5Z01DRAFT_638404 [Emericellopsis atlantica]